MRNQGFLGRAQCGNAFVIILILIVLLGALTVTMTRMGQNGSEDISQEQARVIASQVLRQAKTMENAVSSLLSRGCSINQLSFENSVVTGYANAVSPAGQSCWLFSQSGAGMAFPKPPAKSNDGSNWFFGVNTTVGGVGPERETKTFPPVQSIDLVMFLPLVDLTVCQAINKTLNIVTADAMPPNVFGLDIFFKYSASSNAPTNGNFTRDDGLGAFLSSSTTGSTGPIWDVKAGCVTPTTYVDQTQASVSGTGKYFFYQVLVER
jgi:hypothetical protein